MSILQKILDDMYVEPELLAELDEEQKQILFCKMREEQLKRWDLYEKECEQKSEQQRRDQRIRWLLGSDGEPWVWVMGEHSEDKTIDQILEAEEQRQARELAEREGEQLRRQAEEELKEKLRLEQVEIEMQRKKEEKEREDEEMRRKAAAAEERRLAEEEEARRQKEKEIAAEQLKNHIREARLAAQKLDQNKGKQSATPTPGQQTRASQRMQDEIENQLRKEEDLAKEKEKLAARLRDEAERRIEKREKEIYQTLHEARLRKENEAATEEQQQRQLWEEQERKSRDHEEQIRSIARKAREQATSMRTNSLIAVINDLQSKNINRTQSLKLPRTSKPKNRDAIVEWFVREERPYGAGLNPETREVAEWFHGIITRVDAENLLKNRRPGAFLVRVSERIWGYTVSYKGADKVKHFLIERSDSGYQFMGSNQNTFDSLWSLVNYHKKNPITTTDKEILVESIGQLRFPPDYDDLFSTHINSSQC